MSKIKKICICAFSIGIWATSYFVGTLPGIFVHLILVPMLISVLTTVKVIPSRYSKKD